MLQILLIALLLLPQNAFERARPGRNLSFPSDHGNHPTFKTEWWYFTGHLATSNDRHFGFELTFFRVALADVPENLSRWRPRELYPAHFAISDLDTGRFHYREKVVRAGPGLAGSEPGNLNVWTQNWSARLDGEVFRVQAAVPEMKLDLQLKSLKPAVLHGEGGYSRKGPKPDQASHYYSLTRLEGRGNLDLEGESHDVTASAWMDHEFMSSLLTEEEVGWDWFSLQLDSGEDLMLFQVRRRGDSQSRTVSGTWVSEAGESSTLSGQEIELIPLDFWKSPATEAIYPIAWRIRIPSHQLELEVQASIPNQELITLRSTGVIYWEGSVAAVGSQAGAEIRGQGYLELTGYSGTRPRI